MQKTAKEVIASGDTTLVVDFAIEANRQLTRTTKELNEAKHHLREVGRNAGSPSVELEGSLGVADGVLTF